MDSPGIDVRPLRTMEGTDRVLRGVLRRRARAGRQPGRRRERRLAGHQRHAQLRARHRVRRPTCCRRCELVRDLVDLAKQLTSHGATPLGRRRPASRPRADLRRARRARGRSPSATSRRRSAPASSASGGSVFKLAFTELRHRLGDVAMHLLDRASLSLDDIGGLESGRHVQARVLGAAHEHRRRHVAGAAQHRRGAGARPAPGTVAADGLRAHRRPGRRSRKGCARSSRGGSRPTTCAPSRPTAPRLDRARWQELGDTGVFSLRIPEADGGLGLGMSEAVLVFEELGRALVPGPARGHRARGAAAPRRCRDRHRDRRPGRGATSRLLVVEHPADLDVLLVLAADGVRRVDPRRSTGDDAARPLDAAHARAGGRRVRSPPASRSSAAPTSRPRCGATAWCSPRRCSSASRARTVELATDYAKEREQFGRAIGSFQAIKHIIADMLVRAEVAPGRGVRRRLQRRRPQRRRSRSGRCRGQGGGGRRRRVANAKACIQVHGGIGLHVGARRAALLEARVCARHPLRQRRPLGRGGRGRRSDAGSSDDPSGIR